MNAPKMESPLNSENKICATRVVRIASVCTLALACLVFLLVFTLSPALAFEPDAKSNAGGYIIKPNRDVQDSDANQAINPAPADIYQKTQILDPASSGGIIDLDQVASWFASDGCGAISLTWGDLEGDGDLDLAVQCGTGDSSSIRVYLNSGQALETNASWESDLACNNPSWGDLDGDGDLDLAVQCTQARVYLNQGGSLQEMATWDPPPVEPGPTAWGDMDGNGFLDLAVGQVVYTNTHGTLSNAPAWTSPYSTFNTASSSWGDMDQDGDLDYATSTHDGYTRVYRNTDGKLENTPTWEKRFLLLSDVRCVQIAWGDVDGDGYPELACSGTNLMTEHTYVYSNTAGTLSTAYWQSDEEHMGYSVDWGDVDGDGDLDLAVGNSGDKPERIYINTGSELLPTTVWETSYYAKARGLAWGDIDGDGDLDLAVAANPPRLHLNRSTGLQQIATRSLSIDLYDRHHMAWGDIDNDGDLDLAMGISHRIQTGGWDESQGSNIKIYLNLGGEVQTPPAQNISLPKELADIDWGDMDGDGYLDLAVGIRDKPNLIYRNNYGSLDSTAVWTAGISVTTTSLAWGDVDSDGDLDLAVGAIGGNRLHLNHDGMLENQAIWSSLGSPEARDIAWGDVDGDGDLDLAAANRGDQNNVYLNVNGSLSSIPDWISTDKDASRAVAWGDVDGDGDLDLAIGNHDQPIKLYMNQAGSLETTASWMAWHADATYKLAWGDVDGDGDLDLASSGAGGWYGNLPSPDRVYINQGGSLQNTEESIWSSIEILNSASVAWGDMDNDGDLDLVAGPRIYRNQRAGAFLHPEQTESLVIGLHSDPVLTFSQPVTALATANLFALPGIRSSGMIPISYTLFQPSNLEAASIRAFYSKDGGDNWQEAVPVPGTQTTLLETSTYPTPSITSTHVYNWDVYNSSFFGRSDDVVLRLEAYPVACCDGTPGSYQYPNQTAGPYQRPYYATVQTFPFRARGTQVRVMHDGAPAEGATVYRIPAGQARGEAISDKAGHPHLTDVLGFLQGRGELNPDDQLIALLPVVISDTHTLFHTNATPDQDSVQAHIVPDPVGGVQTLTVDSSHPLLLFNLDISLQWDARYDAPYLAQLEYNLQRASEMLYDWTDGQAALGDLRLFHNREHWNDAHIRVYASNRLRPMALQGGIVSEVISETTPMQTVTYAPGQVHMGAVWNRYGEAGSNLGDDWPRTLAHELGHFALYLNDNYIGIDPAGQLIPVDSCPGSMSDPYRLDFPFDEFHPDTDWLPDCQDTLSHQTTARSDWATIDNFYPQLHGPTGNNGPSSLPLQVTQLEWSEPLTPTSALDDPTFYFTQAGERVQPASGARAFLFQDDWAIDLGGATLDRILARGASPGDRLCLYEPADSRLGCELIQLGDEHLELYSFPDWQPQLTVTPVNSITLDIQVDNLTSGLELSARLYPFISPASSAISLTESALVYSGTLNLPEPILEGYVQVWVHEDEPRREIITDFSVGGNPSHMRGSGSHMRGSGSHMRGSGAPVLSADGHVILFVDDSQLEPHQFYTLQAATHLPEPPPWATPVGQAYHLTATPGAPLLDSALSFTYMASEVPPGEENGLSLYLFDGDEWTRLDTQLDTYFNMASAPVQGPGLYALMSSLEIPLQGAGWNLFSYYIPETRPLSEALASIEDYYSTVYGYQPGDALDPWRVFDVLAPDWVNDLYELEFGHSYWISVTQPLTLYLKGTSYSLRPNSYIPSPPATFYGHVLGGSSFTPTPGMLVTAWVDSHLCGQALTQELDGGIVYAVKVKAYGTDAPGCGTPDQEVLFQVDGETMTTLPILPTPLWDNSRPRRVLLLPNSGAFIYFYPLIYR